jgi:hypothetical protein
MQQHHALKLESDLVTNEIAEVLVIDGASMTLATPLRRFEAKKAVSCLVAPRAGDTVLVGVMKRSAYVLAVLERQDGEHVVLSADGDLAIQCRNGSLSFAARDGVDVTSQGEVQIASASMSLLASDETRIAARSLSLLARIADVDVDRVRAVARGIETFAERVVRRVKRAVSFVEETEQVYANHIELSAKSSARLHGEATAVTANGVVKVDGAQVHVG